MKKLHLSTRVMALLMAAMMLLTMAACGKSDVKPADDASSSSSEPSGVQEFVNPLGDPDLSPVAEPLKPEGDLLAKMNSAFNQNNDVIGWLSIPDTTMDNEVLFYADDKNNPAQPYYERRDITKQYNWYGCYWADYECKFGDRNSISQNTIIYGHSMDDNPESVKMSQLKKYTNLEWAKTHPYIYFSTPEDNMTWKVFSVMYTDTNLAYVHPEMKSADFTTLMKEAKDRSVLDIDVDVNANDKILTLSTCTYPTQQTNKHIDEQTRFVVMARLVRPGEEMPATVDATVNADVKKPIYK